MRSVGPFRHAGHVPLPADLPPRLEYAARRALRYPEEIHTDSCGWMGAEYAHPCSCGLPALVAWLVERFKLDADRD